MSAIASRRKRNRSEPPRARRSGSGEYIAGYIRVAEESGIASHAVYAEVAIALGRVELELGDNSQGCALFCEAESAWNEFNPRSRWAREVASLRVQCGK